MHKVCMMFAKCVHQVCTRRLKVHFFSLHYWACKMSAQIVCIKCVFVYLVHTILDYTYEYWKCAHSLHIVCNGILLAYICAFFVRCAQYLHLQILQTLCTLLILYKIKTTTKCAISLHIVRKSRCAVSLHLVCILRVFTKCLHSLHKVCIFFHKLITKCALSVPDADFADLVQQYPCSTRFGAPAVQTP